MKFVYIFTWDPQSIDYSTVKRQFFGEGSPLGALLCQVSIMKRYEEQRSSGHNSRSSGCRDWAPIFRVMATKLCNKKDATILKSDMESKQTRSEHIRYQYMWSVNPGKSRMYSSFHHLQQQFFQTVIKSSSHQAKTLGSYHHAFHHTTSIEDLSINKMVTPKPSASAEKNEVPVTPVMPMALAAEPPLQVSLRAHRPIGSHRSMDNDGLNQESNWHIITSISFPWIMTLCDSLFWLFKQFNEPNLVVLVVKSLEALRIPRMATKLNGLHRDGSVMLGVGWTLNVYL